MFLGRSLQGGGAEPPVGVPSKPTAFSISVISDTRLDLSWTNNGPAATSVEIQDRDSDDTWSALTTEAAGSTTYSDTSLSANQMKGYRVRGVNAAGNGAWSDTDGDSDTFIDATTESGSILPAQTIAAGRVLRAWCKERVEADFDISWTDFDDQTVSMSDDETFQIWSAFEERNFKGVSGAGFRRQSSEFVLSNIESNSLGQVNLDSGASGSVDSITVNSVEIMSGAESFSVDLATTATAVVANINAHTSSPDYSARALGPRIVIVADATGSGPNSFVVTSSTTTIVTTDTDMAGGGGRVRMQGSSNGFITASHTAFGSWFKTPSTFNKQANTTAPYYRAYVTNLCDICNFYDDYPTGSERTDYSGNKFAEFALVHWMHENHTETGMDVLGANARWAFEYLLELMWQGLEGMDVGGGGGADMEAFQIRAAAYMVGLGLISDARYTTQVTKVLSKITNPRGSATSGYHCDHGSWTYDAPDNSYEGIWLVFLGPGAAAEEALTTSTLAKDALIRHTDCLAHMATPEYNWNADTTYNTGDSYGRIIGNTGSNTGAAGGLATQWIYARREFECAFYNDNWKFQTLGSWRGRHAAYSAQKMVKSVADMQTSGNGSLATSLPGYLNGSNNQTSWKEPSYSVASPYASREYWVTPISAVALHSAVFSGYHTALFGLLSSDPSSYKFPPMRRGSAYIEEHGDFKSALIGSLGMSLHLGPVVGAWAGGIASFGGGGIQGLWLDDYGTFIDSVSSGNQNSGYRETWADYETWAVHAVSGEDDGALPFSSARDIGQGLSVSSVGANTILCSDADDMSSAFAIGDKLTVLEGAEGNGTTSTFTVSGSGSSWSSNILTINTTEAASGLDTGRSRVYSHYFVKNGVSDFDAEYRGKIGQHQGSWSVNKVAAITGDITYTHTYAADANILDVTTAIATDNTDVLDYLWMQIPVFLRWDGDVVSEGGAELTDTTIEYWNGSSYSTLTTSVVSTREIRLGRAGDTGTMDGGVGTGYVYIYFGVSGEDMALSSAVHDVNSGSERSRNVKVDMLGNNLDGSSTTVPASASINYQFRTTTGI